MITVNNCLKDTHIEADFSSAKVVLIRTLFQATKNHLNVLGSCSRNSDLTLAFYLTQKFEKGKKKGDVIMGGRTPAKGLEDVILNVFV